MIPEINQYVEHDASYSWQILLTNFPLVTLNDALPSFKINGNFRHNQIAIYDFTATWFSSSFLETTMNLVTMVPSIQIIHLIADTHTIVL